MSVARALLLGVLVSCLPTLGCQVISASVSSPSDSISGTGHAIAGIFSAISTSSGSGGDGDSAKESYRRDLRQYTAAFARSGGTSADFLRGVTRIAENHGVSHWEAEPATPFAIGQGMREASFSEAEMNAFCSELGAGTPAAEIALRGWQSAGG
ncbi:MAG: putative lipoprotein [Deltaproteobacteria bacterium]|nr:putative lipoprotein [Deltaproteobacteria bacterium]